MRPTRLGEAYHIERAVAARQGITRYPCGCEKCNGFKSHSTHRVKVHHQKYGRDTRLNEPLLVNLHENVLFNGILLTTIGYPMKGTIIGMRTLKQVPQEEEHDRPEVDIALESEDSFEVDMALESDEVEMIHYCDCERTLYWKDKAELVQCPYCQKSWYIPGSNTMPVRVLRYFSLIRRLRRMFRCPQLAKHMRWHSRNHTTDRKLRSVANSEEWKFIEDNFPHFSSQDRNVRMGLALDRVNPHSL